jgi:hypothetical protein
VPGHAWPGEAEDVLRDLTASVQDALGDQLVGLYVFGSLVTGDFDPTLSDIDLLAVLASDLTEPLFGRLDRVHNDVRDRHPEWTDRIEVIYFTATALASFRGTQHPIAAISPGEPFNLKVAHEDWNSNWYVVRNHGVALVGPDPRTLIGPIDVAEVTAQQRKMSGDWAASVGPDSQPGFLAYRILTACRALYTAENQAMASKRGAGEWARQEMPEWADLIDLALRVRAGDGLTGHLDLHRTRDFLSAAAQRLGPGPA